MKVVLSSRGSRGDVYPIIEIGAALKRAGLKVSICVPEMFGTRARGKGLKPLLYSEDSAMVMEEMGSGIGAIKTAIDWFSRAIDEQMEYLLAETADADLLVTSVNEVAVPTVAEYRDIPHYRIAYTPVLPGYHPPPLIPWQRLPRIANRGLWNAVNAMTGFMFRKHINGARRKLGMAGMGGVNDYFTGRSHTILAINPVLAPPCRTWRRNYDYSYTGYCYGDIDGGLGPDLARFLEDGPPPVYIGFGSVSVDDSAAFTRVILEAVKRARCRAVLGTGWTGLGNMELPPEIFPVGDSNHATLFRFCAGAAHHGGSGTTHTAARAGVPQFIMPQIADQFYWGHRVHRLGLGPAPVPPRRISAGKLARALSEMIENRAYAENARALGEEMKHEDGVPGVVDIVTGRGIGAELSVGAGGMSR
ncbi:MAG TPA: glycosyltransferase [Spirochaetota bacterium]|nr:glycosyltransferase [Spirochaetota bacterium]HPC39660.1 glycosyltransferase [Spirochaetota bacterium]HPL17614.1 glycosyltransferase [Spirochaetota bacterium]HQF07387.1 glycosyltransferase [Spirochaetota bacterium]HQH96647.1 glycosyltransferase [Spirochaetota bacterium]